MSASSPSSAGQGPSSSPFAGTDATQYSPEMVRPRGTKKNIGPASSITKSVVPVVKQPAPSLNHFLLNGIKYEGLTPGAYPIGTFSNELAKDDATFISRFLAVDQTPDGIGAGQDSEMEQSHVQHQMKLVSRTPHLHDSLLTPIKYQVFASSVPVYSRGVYLRFDNLRDACEGKQVLDARGFAVRFVDNYDFAIAKSQDTATINEFEGQINVVFQVVPTEKQPATTTPEEFISCLTTCVRQAMATFGAIYVLAHMNTDEKGVYFSYRVEFHSGVAATRAVASLHKDGLVGVSSNVSVLSMFSLLTC
jgi:hypothetical protein